MVRPFQSYWASNCYAIHNNEIIIDEVKNIIIKSPSKCCSLDPVPTWLLKLCVSALLLIITAIVNVSIDSGYVTPVFKCVQIRPLLKKPTFDSDIL